MEPSETVDRIQFAIDAFQVQTDRYLSKHGFDADDLDVFYEFARTQKGDLREALESQLYAQDMSVWKGLISKYIQRSRLAQRP